MWSVMLSGLTFYGRKGKLYVKFYPFTSVLFLRILEVLLKFEDFGNVLQTEETDVHLPKLSHAFNLLVQHVLVSQLGF
jgi:hypothetical protein